MINNISTKISIVTPSLNQGKYIEDTIKSVISQEGDFYIDYIIADGGSVDETVDVIKKYENLLKNKEYPIKCLGVSLKWWSKKDKGQANAINMGLEVAEGEIYAYINSDDFYEEGAFKVIVEEFKKDNSLDLVHGSGRVLYINEGNEEIMEAGDLDFQILLRRGCLIFQPSTFFTRDIFKKTGNFNEDFNFVMDYDLWLRISLIGKMKYIPRILSNFRFWSNSKTSLYKKKFVEERKILYKKYGGNKIDYGTIGEIRAKIKIFNYFKKYFPNIYKYFKNKFYSIVDLYHYKKEK